jgi:hypothetical protein
MFSGRVVNISLTGMRLQITRPVKEGAALAIKYDTAASYISAKKFDVDTVHTRVVWVKRHKGSSQVEIGVTYTDANEVLGRSWIKHALRQLGFDLQQLMDRRKQMRLDARLTAGLSPADDGWSNATPGTVMNLGPHGCYLESRAPFRVHSRLRLILGPLVALPQLTLNGRVLRCDKVPDEQRWNVALQFETPNPSGPLLERYLISLMTDES